MLRYITPLFLFGSAAYVWHYNLSHDSSMMMLPLLDAIPQLAGDPRAQADLSWKILAGLGAILLLLSLASELRGKPKQDDEP